MDRCIENVIEFLENQDGSLCAHIPVAWIKINPAKQLSKKQRREIAERFKRK